MVKIEKNIVCTLSRAMA